MDEEKKRESYEFGLFAEEVISQEYLKNNYIILERRWHLGKTEIDIIAQKESTIILIEVKARSGDFEDALSSVTADKRKRMVRAADTYIKKLKGTFDYRFDIATVTGNNKRYTVEIYEDAFVAADIF